MGIAEAALLVIWCISGFISGVCSLGGAIFAVSAAPFFLPLREVILVSCILNFFIDAGVALMHLRSCLWKSLLPMLATALPGIYIFRVLPQFWLRILVGTLLILFSLWTAFGRVRARRESTGMAAAAGFFAGVFGGSISLDGPPAGIYAVYANWEPRQMLGTLSVFFSIREFFTCILQYRAGLYTPEVIHYSLIGLPACIAGLLLAYPVANRISRNLMQRLVVLIVIIGGITCIARFMQKDSRLCWLEKYQGIVCSIVFYFFIQPEDVFSGRDDALARGLL